MYYLGIALDLNFKKAPRKVLRRPNTNPAPFVICEFCKSIHMHGNAPQGHLIASLYPNAEVRRSGVRCAAGCCIKSVKNVFRTRVLRGRDAWESSIDTSIERYRRLEVLNLNPPVL
jgi:hypothetical protein